MKNFPKVSIGIPAYNEERNIAHLIRDFSAQTRNSFVLDKIIIVDDGSTDKTSEKVSEVDNQFIQLIKHETRLGIAQTANDIFEESESDILVFINADVEIRDHNFIEKIIQPIISGQADIVSGTLEEMLPKTFIEKILKVGMDFKKRVFVKYNNGQNMYTCHGPMRAFSKNFYKQMRLKRNIGDDMYSYLFAIKNGYKYASVPKAVLWYKLPDTLRDHIKQSVRFFKSPKAVELEFGKDFVNRHCRLPIDLTIKEFRRSFFRDPARFSLYVILALIVKFLSFFQSIGKIEQKWGTASSSKKLHRNL